MMSSRRILALCLFHANVGGAIAFFVNAPTKTSSVQLMSSPSSAEIVAMASEELAYNAYASLNSPASELPLFPLDMPTVRIEGANSLRTVKIPQGVDKMQMIFKTDGRPMKAHLELWLGPLRKTHHMIMDVENGAMTPFRALLKFKHTDPQGNQLLAIRNTGTLDFPLQAGFELVPPEASNDLAAMTKSVWQSGPPLFIQGGATRSFPIPADVESVQVVISSKGTGSKSSKALIEILQGPNNKKQTYDLHLGGGSQPYHAIFMTPGADSTLRFVSKQFITFPFEIAVVPYEYSEGSYPPEDGYNPILSMGGINPQLM